MPYASMVLLSTPEERAEMAASLSSDGWKAIKIRLHHETINEDIRTVELVKEAVKGSMEIMVDANQAQSFGRWQPGVIWDYQEHYKPLKYWKIWEFIGLKSHFIDMHTMTYQD